MAERNLPIEDDEEEDLDEAPQKGKKPKKEKKPEKPKKEKKPKEPKPPKPPKPPKEKKERAPGEEGPLAKILKGFLFVLIVGGISAFLFFNVFGIRQNYLVPQLRKIPVVKNFIPYLEGEEIPEVVDETNPDAGLSKNQLLEKIAILEKEIADLQTAAADRETYIDSLNKRILDLQVFENEQETFKKNKEEFDIMIGEHDPNAYAAFYEQIDPETAERLYQEAVTQNALDAEQRKQISTFQEMKPASAATLMEEMIRTDIDLVVLILENVDAKQRADILAAMSARNAAAVTKRLIPEQQ